MVSMSFVTISKDNFDDCVRWLGFRNFSMLQNKLLACSGFMQPEEGTPVGIEILDEQAEESLFLEIIGQNAFLPGGNFIEGIGLSVMRILLQL